MYKTEVQTKSEIIDQKLEQAKQYCYNIQKQLGGELPFCFYTNGHEIYFFWDLDQYPPRKVVGFPTRDDLERFQTIRRNNLPITVVVTGKERFTHIPIAMIRSKVIRGIFNPKKTHRFTANS